jgi:fructokinase
MLWGIDLGGTKIEAAVLTSPEQVAARQRIPTEAHLGYEHILRQVSALVEALKSAAGEQPQRIGIGHPGVIDPATGLMKNSNTICLNGKPLKSDLEAALGVPVAMSNDANCFALAEAKFGAAKGKPVVFGVILGTGVGGGVVVNGHALYGTQGIAGEWGHNILLEGGAQCYCGKRGCVETVISGPALERFYAERSGAQAKLSEIAARAARDPAAKETVDRLTDYFGRAIAYVINILDPDVVVLGGGVSNIDALYSAGRLAAARFVFNNRMETVLIKNVLGDSSGVFGAALLAAG